MTSQRAGSPSANPKTNERYGEGYDRRTENKENCSRWLLFLKLVFGFCPDSVCWTVFYLV